MTPVQDPNAVGTDEFFLKWLPEQLSSLGVARAITTSVSLLVDVEEQRYLVSVAPGNVQVTRESSNDATFRVQLTRASFDRFVGKAAQLSLEESPAVRLLSLDAETVELIASVPGCLQARIEDGEEAHSIVFGPGSLTEVGCTVIVSLSDLERVERGEAQPFELLMNGKLRIEGDPQIAMALASIVL